MDLTTVDISVKSLSMNHKNALLFSAAKCGDHNLAHFLLDQCKVDPNAREINFFPPLFEASQNGHVEIVRLLIRYGADINLESKTTVEDANRLLEEQDGFEEGSNVCMVTPLHNVVIKNQLEVSKILIENGAKVNKELGYGTGFSPLYSAVRNNALEMAKLLIQNGAEIHSKDRELTLLQIAIQSRNLDMVKLLVANGADIQSDHLILAATWVGHYQIVKFLVDSGADICEKTKYGDLPIHRAIKLWSFWSHRDESMKILQILTSPETVNSISTHVTPLRLAAEKGLLPVVMFLLENGAIPDENDLKIAKDGQIFELLKNEIEIRKLNHNYSLSSKFTDDPLFIP